MVKAKKKAKRQPREQGFSIGDHSGQTAGKDQSGGQQWNDA